ncbi:MAG TPA: DUF6460 domain-containing protein [Hyphomicrobiales bacterium]|jgi:hypothetical protein
MERFFGGNPLAVTLRLIIISIVAGIALKAAGFDPRDLFASIPRLIQALYDFGFAWVESAVQYFLLGAVIVVPIWFLIRFLKFIAGDAGKGDAKPRS